MSRIPCTVAILTRNSADTLRRALESVAQFDDIVVCDAGSTDNTIAIAQEFGARIIVQDPRYLGPDGRIADFAGVRNQTLAAAKHQWFLFLDSDEYFSPALVSDIRAAVAGQPAAYWVPRRYVYQGTTIDCAVTYPTQQMRLFHRSVVREFIKPIHERIELAGGVVPRWLREPMLVPLPDTVHEMKNKWRRYLALERTRREAISPVVWLRIAAHEAGIAALYLVRLVRIQLWCRGSKLPVRFELARVWYQWRLIIDSWHSMV